MTTFTPDQWIIIGLVFVLGLLIGMWLTSGGRRKWKARYNDELEHRRRLEREAKDREAHWATREKEWREQDSLRGAATRDRTAPAADYDRDLPRRDTDRDGVPDRDDRRPIDDRRY
jgi:hypothetical protein